MAQRIKWIDAGPLHLVVLYPQLSGWDSEKVRAEKKKASTAAQKLLNQRWSSRRLAFLMALNFSPGDHVFLLTFDQAHLPRDQGEVLRAVSNFYDRLKYRRDKRGVPTRMLFRDEFRHGDGRRHVHALINNEGDLEDIQQIWGQGYAWEVPFKMLPKKNAVSLAKYWTKEKRERLGQKGWYKRGTIRTDYEVQRWAVEDGYSLSLPPGAHKLEGHEDSNEYGEFQFLFYMDKNAGQKRKRRPPPRKNRGEILRPGKN